jgi:exonuclease VII small subunit
MTKEANRKKLERIIEELREVNLEDSKLNGFYWKNEMKYLVESLERHLDQAQQLYDDMKENGLSFSTIEAEGYLRGMKTAVNVAKEAFENSLDGDEE